MSPIRCGCAGFYKEAGEGRYRVELAVLLSLVKPLPTEESLVVPQGKGASSGATARKGSLKVEYNLKP